MITIGTPLAGRYTENGHKTTDYTGVVIAVDTADEDAPDLALTTVLFYGGRVEHYITDANGHSVDTGMTPVPCTHTDTLTPVH